MAKIIIEKKDEFRWRIPKKSRPGMRVDGMVYSSEHLIEAIRQDDSLEQVANVATLPGIVGASMAMPDIHRGYGFPIGGVAAFDLDEGIISPGGVGYDINCGISLTRTNLPTIEIKGQLSALADALFANVPCGVGIGGDIKLGKNQVRQVAELGARWAMNQGLAAPGDLDRMEECGRLDFADPEALSDRACERGSNQLGTLGSGNHFVEVQMVDEVFDQKAAEILGIRAGFITLMVHSGSRGFGYQICDEQLRTMGSVSSRYNIQLPDRQLACAPIKSPEGKAYSGAMAAAANYAWANRIILVHRARRVFEQVFGQGYDSLGMGLVFDVSHNIAKFESHNIEGRKKDLCVHRKGATRAFGPGDPRIPDVYRTIGQPVLIPGDMGTASYVLTGTERAMEETFGSACHGAGRVLSRKAALRATRGRNLAHELELSGITVRARSTRTLGEEAPGAYKDIDAVVEAAVGAGIVNKVARLKPLVVIKG